MTTVVEISDSEDSDDCVINSVVFVDNDPDSDLYREVYSENKLLANIIKNCLRFENSGGMLSILKTSLLKCYYEADKTARESPRIQKNLRRANDLLLKDPRHKFEHIRDLCKILESLKVKKRVPFVTLTTNLTDQHSKPNILKKRNCGELNFTDDTSKKAKLDNDNDPQCSEAFINSIDCSDNDISINIESCSQQSSVAEENKLLVPIKEAPIVSPTEKRIKAIETRIAFYKKTIEGLDLQEVYDDDDKSPYLKSERLKSKIVSLYKKRCELMGNQTVKRKKMRLKTPEGHPPGPVRALERFLNRNINKDGEPPFPDFCDVVSCVTEANEKDGLGWSNAQIMKEATALFTLCGRALQKRRQCREYQDLMYRIKMEELEKDPADQDPVLKAKLEQNKHIAVKKEHEILERYTMMQYLPPKPKSQKPNTTVSSTTTENLKMDEVAAVEADKDARQEVINNNSLVLKLNINGNEKKSNIVESKKTLIQNLDESKETFHTAVLESSDKNNINASNLYSDQVKQTCLDALHSDNDNRVHGRNVKMSNDNENNVLVSIQNITSNINVLETIATRVLKNSAGHKNVSISKEENKVHVINSISDKNEGIKNSSSNVNENEINVDSTENKMNRKIVKSHRNMFKKLGDNFTVTVEIMNDS